MTVKTRGKSDKISSSETRYATEFIFGHLVTKKIHDQTEITISYTTPLVRDAEQGWQGVAIKEADDRYTIKINRNLSRRRQLITLAHELVHVKQYCKGQLGDQFEVMGTNYTSWKKKTVKWDAMGYFFTPWEVEAAGKEFGLYKIYESHVQANRLVFRPD